MIDKDIDILTRQGRENWMKVGYDKALEEQKENVKKLKEEISNCFALNMAQKQFVQRIINKIFSEEEK